MTKTPKSPKSPSRRQPPVETQFQPGKSGNPAGRPKGSLNKITRGRFARMLLEEAERAAPGRPGVSKHRAMIQTLYDQAGMGELKAAALILPLAAEAEAIIAELDAADEERAANAALEAEAVGARAVAADRKRAEAAEDHALATRLAAEDPDLYRHARALAPLEAAPSSLGPFRSAAPTMRFTEAVAKARINIALGLKPHEKMDPYLAAAALAESEGDEEDEEEEGVADA